MTWGGGGTWGEGASPGAISLSSVRTQISDRPQIWPPPAEPPELLGIADGVAKLFSLRFENYIPGTLTVYESTPPASGSGSAPAWTAVSTDPPIVVGTSSPDAVSSPGVVTITPTSMANIADGVYLLIDQAPNQEIVQAFNVTGSSFDANFALAHPAGFLIAGAPPYIVGDPNLGADGTGASNSIVTFTTAPDTGKLIGARYQVTAFSDADLAAYLMRAQTLYSDDISILKRVQFDVLDVVLMDYDRQLILNNGDYRKDPQAYAQSLKTLQDKLRLDLAGGPVAGAAVPAMSIGAQIARRYEPRR